MSADGLLQRNLQEKKTHMEMSQKPFRVKFTGQMPDPLVPTSIEHRALTLTGRTPSVWPHCMGNKLHRNEFLNQSYSGLTGVELLQFFLSFTQGCWFTQLQEVFLPRTRAGSTTEINFNIYECQNDHSYHYKTPIVKRITIVISSIIVILIIILLISISFIHFPTPEANPILTPRKMILCGP